MAEQTRSNIANTAKGAGQAVVSNLASRAGAAAGSAFGPVGTGVGYLAGRFIKYIVILAAGVVLLIIIFLVVIIQVIFGLVSGGEAAVETIAVTKTANPLRLDNGPLGSSGIITYQIEVSNKGEEKITDISVVDDQCPAINFTIDVLEKGAGDSRTVACTVDTSVHDVYHINTATATGTYKKAQVNATAAAFVAIGNPRNGPPAFSPLRGGVYVSGYFFQECTDPPGCTLLHSGLDIATTSSDWRVFSPFLGPAQVHIGEDSSYGVYVDLRSGIFTVRLSHLARGSVTVAEGAVIDSNTTVGVMDNTGFSFGDHVHYEVRQAGVLVDPALFNALTPHP